MGPHRLFLSININLLFLIYHIAHFITFMKKEKTNLLIII